MGEVREGWWGVILYVRIVLYPGKYEMQWWLLIRAAHILDIELLLIKKGMKRLTKEKPAYLLGWGWGGGGLKT
jgi:hypothetical protein